LILSDIENWRKGEIKQLHAQIIECFDNRDVDSYTIFQQGEFYGYFDPVLNKNTRQYNMFILHGTVLTKKQLTLMTRIVTNYIESRCSKITNNQVVYSRLKTDVARLRCFSENFEMLFKPIEKPVYAIVRD
jgi:ribosomal protein S27E